MNDLKLIKHLGLTLLAVLLLAVGVRVSKAVIIEGFTATGQFVSVQVSDDGRLLVSQTSGTAQAVFFLSSQPVNAFQATTPWVVAQSVPIEISTLSISNMAIVNLTTAAVVNTAQITVPGGVTLVLPADAARKSSLLCNTDAFLSAWLGNNAVTTNNGKLFPPGSCMSPDNPIVFTGALYAVSTATLVIDRMVMTQ